MSRPQKEHTSCNVVSRSENHSLLVGEDHDCSTLTICAMLAMRTRSAWRAKMFKFKVAENGVSQAVCCTRKCGFVPGSGVCLFHSSTAERYLLVRIVLVHH